MTYIEKVKLTAPGEASCLHSSLKFTIVSYRTAGEVRIDRGVWIQRAHMSDYIEVKETEKEAQGTTVGFQDAGTATGETCL